MNEQISNNIDKDELIDALSKRIGLLVVESEALRVATKSQFKKITELEFALSQIANSLAGDS